MMNRLSGIPLLLSMVALSLATFLIVLDYSIANVSIPYIAGDLGVSVDQGTYVITSFSVGNAIALPITGWLTKRIGTIRLTLLSLFGFIFFSWMCGISSGLTMLVIARFFQGFAAGPLIPLSQSLTVSIAPEGKRGFFLSLWSTIVVVAPIAGPILGGWISFDFHWPWIFFINIPIGILAIFILRIFLQKLETPIEKPPSDWAGLILLTIGVSSLQILLDKGEQFDWLASTTIRILMATSLISFAYLIAWQLIAKWPLLELRLFKIGSFTLSVLFIGTVYALYFGNVVLVPLWLQEYMGYTPIWAGLAVAPLGILPFLLSWLMGTVRERFGDLVPLGLSLIAFALSSFFNAKFTTDVDFFEVALSRFFFGAGLLLFIVPLFSLSLRDCPPEKYTQATGIFHFVRAMSGGIGTSIFTTLWTRRQAFHHSNLTGSIPFQVDPVKSLWGKMGQIGISEKSIPSLFNDLIDKQAAILGLNDCFYLMGWIFIGMLLILLLGRKKRTAL